MHRAVAVVIAALVVGCAPMLPYRTQVGELSAGCMRAGPEARQSGESNHERLPYADLFFVEFDDQGLLYPTGSEFGQASCHIDALMAGLEALAQRQPLSIIVYVHGWKHNARAPDPDVKDFRALLADAAMVEEAKAKLGSVPHRVVGILVGWRGRSLEMPEPIISLSFWDRKAAAERVAQGESRSLFARLRAFQTAQNGAAGSARSPAAAEKLAFPDKKVLLILVGHSFGGLIIYNSVAQSLINSLYEAAPNEEGKKTLGRFADMIIVANPAFEALRYTPLQRAAEASTFESYQTPIFVSITSEADWATRMAFPLGRYLSTVFESHASDEERDANRRTIGHVDRYITHELKVDGDVCPGWKLPDDGSLPTPEQAYRNLLAEIKNAKAFFLAPPTQPNWRRHFCGNVVLAHIGGHRNSPIWNVRTTGGIVPGHNDIKRPLFINFVRQLYHDVILAEILNPKR